MLVRPTRTGTRRQLAAGEQALQDSGIVGCQSRHAVGSDEIDTDTDLQN
jgi:hypothetical protein